MVFHRRDKNLRFMFQAPEGFTVNDLVPVALESCPEVVFFFRPAAAPRLSRLGRVGRQILSFALFDFLPD
jgi:hypothetical protein